MGTVTFILALSWPGTLRKNSTAASRSGAGWAVLIVGVAAAALALVDSAWHGCQLPVLLLLLLLLLLLPTCLAYSCCRNSY
eukprot:COSAG05_NODE_584_length_8527_cov_46.366279_6_plen_81_part_00